MAASGFVPNSQQKTWMLVEVALKQLSRRARSKFWDSKQIADVCNDIVRSDPFYRSVGNVTPAKVSARCRTWIEAGFVLEKAGDFVRSNPWEIAPKGIRTKPLRWRWIGGRRTATIPGHPDYGDTYHKRTTSDFKAAIRKRLGL